MNQTIPFPEGQEKMLDSTSALEKVIRLDKKHTNFDYYDTFRNLFLRINYPQTPSQGPSSETLLKSLWRHVVNYYFKKIEEGELQRLDYIKAIISSQNQGNHRFEAEQEFWSTLNATFSQQYLQSYLRSARDKANYHNWLELLFLSWNVSNQTNPKEQKKACQQFTTAKRRISVVYDNKTNEMTKLMQQKSILKQLIGNSDDIGDDEVSKEIQQLQSELDQNNADIAGIFDRLKEKVEMELNVQEVLFCLNEGQELLGESVKIQKKLEKIDNFQAQTKYIEYIIRQLQKKQIAQSISKIQRVQKSKNQIKILLIFEQSMGIKPQLVSQKQFEQINSQREYSLLKFYNTASKSKFTFVCQNYLGFKDMYQNRNRPCRLRNKDIMEQMKRSSTEPVNAPFYREFAKMEICHHCKLLHPQSALVKCDYRSSKCGNPIPPSPYYDSYVYQVLKNEQSRTSAIRFLNSSSSRKNSYFHYVKKEDQYVCDRKYCKYCLKNYEENKDKSNGLCPYCRGICYCTRCARNDMMIRLKSMYILMGGDINTLQRESYFEKYYQVGEESMGLRRKDKAGKVSRRNFSAPNRMNDKMVNIRYQLEDLRIICDLVKRRQKNKQKLFGCQKQTFRKKMEIVCPDFNFQSLQEPTEEQEEPQLEVKMSDKLTKKLKRMIS